MELITARWAGYENSRRWLIYIYIYFISIPNEYSLDCDLQTKLFGTMEIRQGTRAQALLSVELN